MAYFTFKRINTLRRRLRQVQKTTHYFEEFKRVKLTLTLLPAISNESRGMFWLGGQSRLGRISYVSRHDT